eukprot:6499618-Alexandrium_andersonii.AAC.1
MPGEMQGLQPHPLQMSQPRSSSSPNPGPIPTPACPLRPPPVSATLNVRISLAQPSPGNLPGPQNFRRPA